MRVAHLDAVARELVGNRAVVRQAPVFGKPPRAQVELVDRQRLALRIGVAAVVQVGAVLPGIAPQLPHLRGRGEAVFCMEGKRVGLLATHAVGAGDAVLVEVAVVQAKDHSLPYAVMDVLHGGRVFVPGIEVSDNRDTERMRRPHDKEKGILASLGNAVASERVVRALSVSPIEQVQIGLVNVLGYGIHRLHPIPRLRHKK